MSVDELLDADATAQSAAVRTGEVAPAELLDGALRRIDVRNPALNAVIHRLDDKARAAIAAGLPDGPFTGVPMLVKDGLCHTAGDPFHCGMRVLRDLGWTEPDDSWLAARFRAAGFVIAGKTNLPELAASVACEPLAYGPTLNPWNLQRSAGGSSGGSAAAVAARMVAVAHGNDMGGSIRFPASMCGIVGLKPTRARTTLGPTFGEFWGMTTHEFALVRSIRDVAGVLDAVQGPGVGDPYTVAAPVRPYVDELSSAPPRLRIGVSALAVDDDCVAATNAAATALEALGHNVGPTDLGWLSDSQLGEGLMVLFPSFIARDVDRWSTRIGREIALDELEPGTAEMVAMGRTVTAVQWQAGTDALQSWSRRAASCFVDDYDLLLTPTVPHPPVEIGATAQASFDDVHFTMPFNVTGQPAMSLPVHWSAEGLPIGVQLVAPYGREDLLVQVGAQLETAFDWQSRRPPGV
jgi:amidase